MELRYRAVDGSRGGDLGEGQTQGGGGVYSSFALDTETGILYSPTGNPGPDFVASYRPGDNLYTCSIVMLDARTGALRGYYQLVKNDFHDWDLAASPILFTSKAGKKMVAAAGKNGYLYGLDRELKTVLYKVPVTRIENTEAPLTTEGTRFLPGVTGWDKLVWAYVLARRERDLRPDDRLGDDN